MMDVVTVRPSISWVGSKIFSLISIFYRLLAVSLRPAGGVDSSAKVGVIVQQEGVVISIGLWT